MRITSSLSRPLLQKIWWFETTLFSTNPKTFYLGHNGSVYRQDVAAHHQQFGVPACSQCGRQEGLPHGGHGLFLHNVLHSGKRMGAFIDVY